MHATPMYPEKSPPSRPFDAVFSFDIHKFMIRKKREKDFEAEKYGNECLNSIK
jgi:hypothetical protein